jgi:hypothetical protein
MSSSSKGQDALDEPQNLQRFMISYLPSMLARAFAAMLCLLLQTPRSGAEEEPLQPSPHFSFLLDHLAWYSTDVVVASEGEKVDGKLKVLEVWRGSLKPGMELSVPALARFSNPGERFLLGEWSLQRIGVPPNVLTGERIVLFLRESNGHADDETDLIRSGKRLWEPTAAHVGRVFGTEAGKTPSSVAWIKEGCAFCFRWTETTPLNIHGRILKRRREGEPKQTPARARRTGIPALSTHPASESLMRAKVVEFSGLGKPDGELVVVPNGAEDAKNETARARFKVVLPTDGGFSLFAKKGNPFLPSKPALETRLRKDGPRAMVADLTARGEVVAPFLVNFLEQELAFWNVQSRIHPLQDLNPYWWNGWGISDRDEEAIAALWRRYVITREIVHALGSMEHRAAREVIEHLHTVWKQAPGVFEDADPLHRLTHICQAVLWRLEHGKDQARILEGEAWLKRAGDLGKQPDQRFLAALMAARAIGFVGFGREEQPDSFRQRYPVLLDRGSPLYRRAKEQATQLARVPRPVLQSPAGRFCAWAENGESLVTTDYNHRLGIWHLATERKMAGLASFSPIHAVVLPNGGNTLAFTLKDRTFRRWDYTDDRSQPTLLQRDHTFAPTFSPDGKTLAALGPGDKRLRLWDYQTGEPAQPLEGQDESSHLWRAGNLAFSPDGAYLAGGSSQPVWDLKSRRRIRHLEGHEGESSIVTFSPNGKFLVSGGTDGKINLWHVEDGWKKETLAVDLGSVQRLAISPNSKILAFAHRLEERNTIRVWDLEAKREIHVLPPNRRVMKWLSFSPDGKLLGTDAVIWALDSEKEQGPRNLAGYLAEDWFGMKSDAEPAGGPLGPQSLHPFIVPTDSHLALLQRKVEPLTLIRHYAEAGNWNAALNLFSRLADEESKKTASALFINWLKRDVSNKSITPALASFRRGQLSTTLDPSHLASPGYEDLNTAVDAIHSSPATQILSQRTAEDSGKRVAGKIPRADLPKGGFASKRIAKESPVLYYSISQAPLDRNPENEGKAAGIYKSHDGGATWTLQTREDVSSLLIHPDTGMLYAVFCTGELRVAMSEDGEKWRVIFVPENPNGWLRIHFESVPRGRIRVRMIHQVGRDYTWKAMDDNYDRWAKL